MKIAELAYLKVYRLKKGLGDKKMDFIEKILNNPSVKGSLYLANTNKRLVTIINTDTIVSNSTLIEANLDLIYSLKNYSNN